ncbi:MAG TPA: bifunctional oligoribonuclease/PAP phosphatase NrnA [Anaerolineales bacterium]|nr:bifunctional oligoribonuclease/PAP phosphatase NrnA [Anaerolineales bacterium]
MNPPANLDRILSETIEQADQILVIAHVRPDGDAIGSLLGLGLALREKGKPVELVVEDGLPATFKNLPGWELVRRKPSAPADLVITVDCSDLARLGSSLAPGSQVDINIDHHITNQNFGRFNLVDTRAVATAEILARHLPEWGYPISPEIAAALLTGLITDSLGFRTSNMTPEALRIAAGLMEAGANLPELYRHALISQTFQAVKFWGSGFSRMQRMDRIVWTSITQTDRLKAQYPGRDDADMINVLSAIDDSDVVILFNEQGNGHIKVSWRSQPGIDITPLALQYGGGGHPAASGADVEGSLAEVEAKVLQSTRNFLRSIGNG